MKDFFIGTSSSAWQIEGNSLKTQESWADLFYKTDPSKWVDGQSPDVASDFIHHYKEDIQMMAKAGMDVFRFTIQWPFFLSDCKKGIVNPVALDFYRDVITEIRNHGMEPFVSLEHWDIPAEFLTEFDGWVSHQMIEYYRLYVSKVFESLSDVVTYFFAFTEPNIPIDNGYMDGIWYPFEHDPKKAYQAHFHKMVATSVAKQEALKFPSIKLGVMIHYTPVYARSNEIQDVKAAYYADLLQVRIYLNPYLKGKISDEFISVLKQNDCMFQYTQHDLDLIKQYRIDWIGLDYYFPIRVKAKESEFVGSFHPTEYYDLYEMPGRKFNADRGWEVYEQALLDAGRRLKTEYGNPDWFVSENGIGIANEEKYRDASGQIQDDYRIEFLSGHLNYALKAKEEGCPCHGYLVWSFVDNLSALNAFKNRYGLLELDLKTQKRIPKKSYFYFQNYNQKRKG